VKVEKTVKIDDKDRAILSELTKNSKLTTGKLSKKLGMPVTTVHNRMKKLEKGGVIINYTLNIDWKKLGRPIMAYISIEIDYGSKTEKITQLGIANKIKALDGVKDVTILAGGTDIMARVLARDIDDLNNLVTDKLRNISGVDRTQTMIVLQQV